VEGREAVQRLPRPGQQAEADVWAADPAVPPPPGEEADGVNERRGRGEKAADAHGIPPGVPPALLVRASVPMSDAQWSGEVKTKLARRGEGLGCLADATPVAR